MAHFGVTMLSDFHWLTAGYCRALEALTLKEGAWRWESYPAKFAVFRHPERGWCLFDTGYAPRFLQATSRFPYKLYELATPVFIQPEETAANQLRSLGLRPSDIKFVLLSHLHADHIAGLLDFPNAEIVTTRSGFEAFRGLRGLKAVRKGFLPQLLPSDFAQRAFWVDGRSDLWDDGSVKIVPLPGHAAGQFGVILQLEEEQIFLCADACWHSKSYRQNVDLPWITHLLLTESVSDFRASLDSLVQYHREHPETRILPSHCVEC